ncbi:hypothetical protein PN498_05030 [Oscillatoria sp. CS-180]|uniref:hypothetical protein n=1 Tax=Oscillatoria sp. CS-180 TaxID=3021720 RepID=UPI0023302198|nr:hypothetical protein [Oscillatoria sp. CS-180]MDB9525341.1 hypothetical protein [Oscillatoria sp. CS-180]
MQANQTLVGTLLFGDITLPKRAIAPVKSPVRGDSVLRYSDYMRLGYEAQHESRYYEAIQFFRHALYVEPGDPEAVAAHGAALGIYQQRSNRACLAPSLQA